MSQPTCSSPRCPPEAPRHPLSPSKLGAIALVALLLLAGLGAAAPTPAARSPEEAFGHFKKASAEISMKALLAIVTPELTDRFVAGLIRSGLYDVQKDAFKFDKTGLARMRAQERLAVLAWHGVTEGDLKKGPEQPKLDDPRFRFKNFWEEDKKAQEEQKKYARKLAARVKDKVALLLDMEVLEKKYRTDEKTRKQDREWRAAMLAATLKGLKIAGDRATGTVVIKDKDGKGKELEREDPIAFKKVGGNWRIDGLRWAP
jgi:hypothetical protein